MKHIDYQTPQCTVCMLEVEGEILTTSSTTWGGALNGSLTYDFVEDDELN